MPIGIYLRLRTLFSKFLSPARIFVLSFVAVILTGGILLGLPFSAARGPIRFVDALFTSTSAVCVTGLVVLDTGKDYSIPGQVITLLLIQIGGLGIITFSTVFFVLMGRGISFKGREIVQSTLLHTPRRDFMAVAKTVVIFTAITELGGALLLLARFSQDFPFSHAVYQSVFHAVSAFNNAGFSLFSNNLAAYQGDLLVNLTVMGLVVHGGIGFIVQYEVWSYLRGVQKKLSLHAKIVLITTAILIVSGALLFYLFERNHLLREVPLLPRVLAALFQSVTPRTAGFNTVEIGALTNASILLLMFLMFIGASPGSTGGGVKTTSAALLIMLMWSRMKGYLDIHVFNRTIPREVVSRAISIIFASAFAISLITSVLLLSGTGGLPASAGRHFFVEYLFEVVSAFATVGLSMGVTPELNDLQKYALVLMMFAGRVGPLTLAFSLSRSVGRAGVTYAEEGMMVG
jgi:trk system potassium uptake protein TrkH